jgi:TolA-binding protein
VTKIIRNEEGEEKFNRINQRVRVLRHEKIVQTQMREEKEREKEEEARRTRALKEQIENTMGKNIKITPSNLETMIDRGFSLDSNGNPIQIKSVKADRLQPMTCEISPLCARILEDSESH